MTKKEAIKIFGEKKVRTVWNDENRGMVFSIVDVVSILTESVWMEGNIGINSNKG